MVNDAQSAAKAFMDALHQFEQSGDPQVMQECFADDAELHALVGRREHTGRDGVKSFWTEYRKPFESIHSDFTHVAAEGSLAVLEWTGKGSLKEANGQKRDIEYAGCSILEFADGSDKVRRFRTFYDSAAFVTRDGD